MKKSHYVLDQQARLLTLQAVLVVCRRRAWIPYAVPVRTNHVHAVIEGEVKPERMLSDWVPKPSRKR